LEKIKIPVLIISGGLDEVKDESEKLYEVLKTEKEFKEIPGAGHLFEEGKTFEKLLELTVRWYEEHLRRGS
jgi:alpha-beta hydrolase superfamily lysophospholipase